MFLGEYEHNLDDKGRLAVPARFREELGAGVIITRGFDHCLMGFPLARWQTLAEQLNNLTMGQGDARNLRRLIFSGASDTPLDRQGRVLIPQNLRDYAGLADQVIIAGVNTHFEIWSKTRWQEVLDSLDVNASVYAEQLNELGL